jgi:hypothetical protein
MKAKSMPVQSIVPSKRSIKSQYLDTDRYHQAIDLIAANQTGYPYGTWNTIQSLLPKQPQLL